MASGPSDEAQPLGIGFLDAPADVAEDLLLIRYIISDR